MSREIATVPSQALSANLLQASIYKPSQGRIVRQMTALAVWVIVALGCYRLYVSLRGVFPEGVAWLDTAIPMVLLATGVWFGFRLVNWPRFADFLIAVEAEMAKVSWPGKPELIRAAIVVIVTILILAITLFLFDIVWQWFFSLMGITG